MINTSHSVNLNGLIIANAKITTGINIAIGSYNKIETPTIIPILNSSVLGCV